MAQPYVGEIRMFAGSFAPVGWWMCDGSLLPISENETLFQLIGTTYGGDGQETFAVPDLRGRIPLHQGTGPGLSNRVMGEMSGVETVTLTINQIPAHTHPLTATLNIGDQPSPANHVPAQGPQIKLYIEDAPDSNFNAAAALPVGGSQPHDNTMPFLCINYIISLFGIFPSQT